MRAGTGPAVADERCLERAVDDVARALAHHGPRSVHAAARGGVRSRTLDSRRCPAARLTLLRRVALPADRTGPRTGRSCGLRPRSAMRGRAGGGACQDAILAPLG